MWGLEKNSGGSWLRLGHQYKSQQIQQTNQQQQIVVSGKQRRIFQAAAHNRAQQIYGKGRARVTAFAEAFGEGDIGQIDRHKRDQRGHHQTRGE